VSTPTDNLITDMLNEAANAINHGDISRGELNLRKVLSADPTNVLALLWMTKCTQDPAERAGLFEEVLQHDPTNPHALKGRAMYQKYVRATHRVVPPEESPDVAASAADFEPTPPSPLALSNRTINTSIAVVAVLLIASLALALRPTLASLFSRDPIDSLTEKLDRITSRSDCSDLQDLAYDVRRTDSLVSPYMATVSGTRVGRTVKFDVTLAYQDDHWVTKGIDAYFAYDGQPISPYMQDKLDTCFR
jgi:hypothetical protein